MKQKSSVSTELTSMTDRNMSKFITYYSTTSRELRQSIRARMTEIMMPKRCGADSSSKDIVCGHMRRTCGRKTDGVQRPGAITLGDRVPGSKIHHRYAKRVKFH
jgi:hypothetical protein